MWTAEVAGGGAAEGAAGKGATKGIRGERRQEQPPAILSAFH